jgi:hypothetical protein
VTSVRFNSPEYLEAWRRDGSWPIIHNALADFAISHISGNFLLDLGCAYGLLGARIAMDAGGLGCAGIDADRKVIRAAQDAGVPMRFYCLRLTRESLPELKGVLNITRAKALIARRILPELWGEDPDGGREFVEALADCGVREIFVEGRVASERSTNPLRSIDEEVALLSARYREAKRVKALSYLVLR